MRLITAAICGIVLSASAAQAGGVDLRCEITTDHTGNSLVYQLRTDGYISAMEEFFSKNGVVMTNYGHQWSYASAFVRGKKVWTFWPNDTPEWALVFEDRQPSTVLLHRIDGRGVAAGHGFCTVSAIQAPPPPAYRPPVYTPPAYRPPSRDEVPIISLGGKGGAVYVRLGGTTLPMLIDTGATMMSLPEDTADALLASGEAQYSPNGPQEFSMADGHTATEQVIVIFKLQIGNHTLYNVEASVAPVGATPLLPFPALRALGATLDTANNQLIFS
jgi:hypothetical protein